MNDIVILVAIKNVLSVFDENETKETMIVLGQFETKPVAEAFRLAFAPGFEHGDRLVIFSTYAQEQRAESDVLVIVNGEVN